MKNEKLRLIDVGQTIAALLGIIGRDTNARNFDHLIRLLRRADPPKNGYAWRLTSNQHEGSTIRFAEEFTGGSIMYVLGLDQDFLRIHLLTDYKNTHSSTEWKGFKGKLHIDRATRCENKVKEDPRILDLYLASHIGNVAFLLNLHDTLYHMLLVSEHQNALVFYKYLELYWHLKNGQGDCPPSWPRVLSSQGENA